MEDRSTTVQKLLAGYPEGGFPTLRNLAASNPDLLPNRTEGEEKVRAVLPGDSLQGHIYEEDVEENPYLGTPRSDLQTMAEYAVGVEQRLMLKALKLQQLQQSDGRWPGRP